MTTPRTVRVYRLAIDYPPGPRRWPQERLFLSRSGARTRATKLRGLGCTVTVHPSRPVTWPPNLALPEQDPQ